MTDIHLILSRWARLGAMFNVAAAAEDVDIERLLLDTARAGSGNARLFVLAASWLAQYGEAVATLRLARMILDELERAHRPTLGFMLEWAQRQRGDKRFERAIKSCGDAIDARPLFDVERQNKTLSRLAEQRASALSRKWGRWTGEFEIKSDALRPAEWIGQNNPAVRDRAQSGGDLCASILADARAGRLRYDSESDLAAAFLTTRSAIRESLHKLRLSGLINSAPVGRRTQIEVLAT